MANSERLLASLLGAFVLLVTRFYRASWTDPYRSHSYILQCVMRRVMWLRVTDSVPSVGQPDWVANWGKAGASRGCEV